MSSDRTNIDQVIADRIASDPSFRQALLSDPHSALATLTDMQIPSAVRITIHEKSPTNIHLATPAETALSEIDLALVAGGGSWGQSSACLPMRGITASRSHGLSSLMLRRQTRREKPCRSFSNIGFCARTLHMAAGVCKHGDLRSRQKRA